MILIGGLYKVAVTFYPALEFPYTSHLRTTLVIKILIYWRKSKGLLESGD